MSAKANLAFENSPFRMITSDLTTLKSLHQFILISQLILYSKGLIQQIALHSKFLKSQVFSCFYLQKSPLFTLFKLQTSKHLEVI